MKRSILPIVIAFIIQIEVSSQSCLPNGITFSTQAQIDNFQINYPGCNSRAEVEDACLVGYLTTSDYSDNITIYPNPAKNEIVVQNNGIYLINKIVIFNLSGQPVIDLNHKCDKIDVSRLEQGMYIMEFVSNERIIRKKLLIKK